MPIWPALIVVLIQKLFFKLFLHNFCTKFFQFLAHRNKNIIHRNMNVQNCGRFALRNSKHYSDLLAPFTGSLVNPPLFWYRQNNPNQETLFFTFGHFCRRYLWQININIINQRQRFHYYQLIVHCPIISDPSLNVSMK